MRCSVPVLALGSILLGVGACSEAPSTDIGTQSSAIIGGQLDTTHEAVMLLATNTSICSATMVKTDVAKGVGWLLTAAHCVDQAPVVAVQGPNFEDQAKTIQYSVLDFKAHPLYRDGAFEHDVAIVRVLGVGASTPVIPMAGASDGMSVGTSVLSVGYGRTTPSSAPADNNNKRKRIAKNISRLTSTLITYSLSGGGICSGDSGGPVLSQAGGEKVVGVHSFVSGDCLVDGSSTRVSSELAFINGEIAKAIPALGSCDLCQRIQSSGTNECAEAQRTCAQNAECSAVATCFQKCSNESCRDTCRAKSPGVVGMINKALSCTCRKGCASECATALACRSVPQCGAVAADECNKCGENVCCTERLAASYDNVGYTCLLDSTGAN
jgi:hypothetical protein